MTITSSQLILYSGALVVLFLTPGPVWIAIIARTISGGLKSGLALVLGVLLGDFLWPFIVYGGLGILTSLYPDIFVLLRYTAALLLILIGTQTVFSHGAELQANDKLTKSGFSTGVSAGLLAVTANPKATLFYFTLLPSFFDINKMTMPDLILISGVSCITPAIGNILILYFLLKVKSFLSSTLSIRLTNIFAGLILVMVGFLIAIV